MNEDQRLEIIELIELISQEEKKLEVSLKENQYANAFHASNTIVDLKGYLSEKNEYIGLEDSIKQSFRLYPIVLSQNNKEYSKINCEYIEDSIEYCSLDNKVDLLKYLSYQFKKEKGEVETVVEEILNLNKLKLYKKNPGLINYTKFLSLWPFINRKRLTIFSVGLLVLCHILLLPTPIKEYYAFQIKYENYSDNEYINIILNHFGLLLGIGKTSLKPANEVGFVCFAFMKYVFVVVIVRYIWEALLKKLNIPKL